MSKITITHKNSKNNCYFIDASSTINKTKNLVDNYIVNNGDEKALIFIVKYINYYNKTNEIPAPDYPMPESMTIIDLFEYEQNIFNEFLHKLDDEQKEYIVNIMAIAKELEMFPLLNKLSCILYNDLLLNDE